MSGNEPELVVVMPVYNEEEIIGEVLRIWSEELRRLSIDFRIHVYNDGSEDNSSKAINKAARANSNIVAHHKDNTGHGPTILSGYRENSTAEWIFQADSDNEIGPEFFQEFWAKREGFDLLVGRRTQREAALSRKLMSVAARTLVRVLYGRGVSDVNCPYRLMRSHIFRDSFVRLPDNTFAPNVIIAGIACKNGYKTLEIPVPYAHRTTGEVTIRRWKLAKAAARSLWQTILYRFKV